MGNRGRRRGWAPVVLAAVVLAAVGSPTSAAVLPADAHALVTPPLVRVSAADDTDVRAAAAAHVAQMTVPEKAASIVMAHLPTADAAAARAFVEATGVGGFILMGANVVDEAAVQAFTASLHAAGLTGSAGAPVLVGVDQEGGIVSRLRWDDAPAARSLQEEPAESAASAFRTRGALVQRAGIDVNFGVVADWTSDPSSFLAGRVLGRSTGAASDRVAASVAGEAPFAATTLKHFPGHGAAPGDSHHMLPQTGMSLDQWRREVAPPFVAGIAGGAELVMAGHLVYSSVDSVPASLSSRWYAILRDELAFDGVAVTDDLGMLEASGVADLADPGENAVRAVAAGADLVLGVSYTSVDRVDEIVDAIVAAEASGRIPRERLDEAAARVLALRLASPAGVAVPCDGCQAAG